ncbi:MAG: Asp-tRNA(Asn)/Glu-tRNA(Gln) amidotransferase subunit GatC [Sulfolobales archaeon]
MPDDLEVWLERVSRLALIKIREDEKELILRDMRKIIEFFNSINALDLSDVEPLFMVLNERPVLRDDVVGSCLSVDEVLTNVKESENYYIKGPRTA